MESDKAIIFDFFGVICSEIAPPWFNKHFGEEKSEGLKDFYFKPFDLGQIKEDELMNNLANITHTTPGQVNTEFQQLIKINSELVELIKKFKSGYKIALCSNGGSNFVRKIIEDNELKNLFDIVVISSEYGVVKPDIKIYEILY